jgi:hypothetical protein
VLTDDGELQLLALESAGADATHVLQISADTSGLDAFVATVAAPGSVLCLVTGPDNQDAAPEYALDGKLCVHQYPVTLRFKSAPPKMLQRGWGRKVSNRPPLHVSAPVDEWLHAQWKEDHKVNSYVLEERMLTAFPNMEELHLNWFDIDRWLQKAYRGVQKSKKLSLEENQREERDAVQGGATGGDSGDSGEPQQDGGPAQQHQEPDGGLGQQ